MSNIGTGLKPGEAQAELDIKVVSAETPHYVSRMTCMSDPLRVIDIPPGSSMTYGDGNGNGTFLLKWIIEHKVLELKMDDSPDYSYAQTFKNYLAFNGLPDKSYTLQHVFYEIVRIYWDRPLDSKGKPSYTVESENEFCTKTRVLMNFFEVNDATAKITLRQIGDLFADRGRSDVTALIVLFVLDAAGINYRLIIGNHDMELLVRLFFSKGFILEKQCCSYANAAKSRYCVDSFFNEAVLDRLIFQHAYLFDIEQYSGGYCFYSHASVWSPAYVAALVSHYDVPGAFDFDSVDGQVEALKLVHKAFRSRGMQAFMDQYVREGAEFKRVHLNGDFAECYSMAGFLDKFIHIFTFWNRRNKTVRHLKGVTYVNGHDNSDVVSNKHHVIDHDIGSDGGHCGQLAPAHKQTVQSFLNAQHVVDSHAGKFISMDFHNVVPRIFLIAEAYRGVILKYFLDMLCQDGEVGEITQTLISDLEGARLDQKILTSRDSEIKKLLGMRKHDNSPAICVAMFLCHNDLKSAVDECADHRAWRECLDYIAYSLLRVLKNHHEHKHDLNGFFQGGVAHGLVYKYFDSKWPTQLTAEGRLQLVPISRIFVDANFWKFLNALIPGERVDSPTSALALAPDASTSTPGADAGAGAGRM